MDSAKHVFVSYARFDGTALAVRIQEALEHASVATWRDQRNINPYQDFSAEIETAIEQSEHVVVCLTPSIATRKDSFVRREITYAQGCGVPISPVLVPTFPVGKIPLLINNLTWLAFWRPDRPEDLDFDYGFARLLERVRHSAPAQAVSSRDGFHSYLEDLYRQIVANLSSTVFSLVDLSARSTSNAVSGPAALAKPAAQLMPMSFFSSALQVRQSVAPAPEPERDFESIFDAFEHARGQLLLLGEPGAGKTTTLMAVAREAVVERLENPGAPLPIVGRIAGWAAAGSPPLVTWLANGVGLVADAKREISEGRALLLLDGLDELSPGLKYGDIDHEVPENHAAGTARSLRSDFIDGLEECVDGNKVLMSCRARDFAEIGRTVPLQGAVTLKPLDDGQLATYLANQPALAAAISNDNNLREMVRTPLLLSLLTFAFGDRSNSLTELPGYRQDSSELRQHIFRQYVERRFQHEALRAQAALEFSLEQTYDVLAEAAVASVDYKGGISDFRGTPIGQTLQALVGDRAEGFVEQAVRLNLLIRPERGSLSFIHLLIRDHFGLSRAGDFIQDPARNRAQLLAFLGATRDPKAANLMFSLENTDGSLPAHVVFNVPPDDPRSVLGLARTLSSTVRYSQDDYVSDDARWQLSSVNDIDMRARHILMSAISRAAGREKADYLVALVFVENDGWNRRVFEKSLSDLDAEVRCCAAWGLGEGAGNGESIPLLTELLDDTAAVARPAHSQGPQHATVREAAENAIRAISRRQ